MTEVTWKRTAGLRFLKTERHVLSMALTAMKLVKIGNEWRMKEERTTCKVKSNAIIAFSLQKQNTTFSFRTIFLEFTDHHNFWAKSYLCFVI